MRPTSKKDLLSLAINNWEKMNALIAEGSEKELKIPFDFSKDEKKKEAHWMRDKNLKDVLIHLYEWHMLVINWVSKNKRVTIIMLSQVFLMARMLCNFSLFR